MHAGRQAGRVQRGGGSSRGCLTREAQRETGRGRTGRRAQRKQGRCEASPHLMQAHAALAVGHVALAEVVLQGHPGGLGILPLALLHCQRESLRMRHVSAC